MALDLLRVLRRSEHSTTPDIIAPQMAVGTLAWARRTAGRLDNSDRLRLMADAILVRLNRQQRARRKPPFSAEVDSLRVPDTAMCGAAAQLLAAVSEAWLVNH